MSKKAQLDVKVTNNKLVISIGLDILIHSVSGEIGDYKITNKNGFVRDIVGELLCEQEDGTTLVHLMFDEAANNAIENGSEHCEEVSHEQTKKTTTNN